ncbi:gluconokinase [Adhaeribacter aquaticus]|uniref:gluconokinase n=1 Tax=Adhaeribacter aquaticus TaxID=299567 RepID=UPI00041128E0|nr:gluconokinase [Adhaeribacter aquaticus]
MKVVIGVDLGTTSTKAVGFSLDGKVICSSYQEYPIFNPQPGFSEQDPEEVYNAVLFTLQEVIAQLKGHDLVGIGFSCAMHSLIAVDDQGQPLTNCIIWADNRSEKQAYALKQTPLGLDIYLHTGTPIHPFSPLCKLIWFQEHKPDVHQQAHKFISIKEYVFYKFFRKYIIDYSLASATGLFDIRNFTWYAPALAKAGISATQLSEPVSTLHAETNLNPEIAAYLGITKPIPFVTGASDGCLANLGTGAVKPGLAALTIGTSGAIRVTAPQPANDNQQRLFNYILAPNQYVVGGAVSNGGIILRWFRDNFGYLEQEEAKALGVDAYDLLLQQAATIPAGAAGLLFLPYLLGERAPIWDAQSRGLFFGLSITHTRAHMLRAVLEGIMFGMYQVAQALEETTGPIDVIFANGGFARSEFWVQLLADVFNKRVVLSETIESGAWGAALLTLQVAGIQPEILVDSSAKEYYPSPENHASYKQNFAIFEKLYPLLKEQMAQISALQIDVKPQ